MRSGRVNTTEKILLYLSSNIPHSEANVLVFDSLHVETCVEIRPEGVRKATERQNLIATFPLTNGRDGRYDLTQLQFIQDSGLFKQIRQQDMWFAD
jgi:hypothetical protein